MAAVNHNPSGFSYAQAARGRSSAATSQTPSSKVASGTASPSTGILSEVSAGRSNWADDVEAGAGPKTAESQRSRQDEQQTSHAKENPVEKAKMEEKTVNGTSGVSSPDLTASSSTTTKDEYDLLSPPNGSSSDSAWEMVSQSSEPAWITDRKERQSSSRTRDRASNKEEKKAKDPAKAEPKPVILHEAAPPSINPWLKRAEEAKAKATVVSPRPPATAPASDTAMLKENQRPRADSRRKSNSVAAIPSESLPNTADESRKPSSSQVKRTNDVRNKTSRQNSEQDTASSRLEPPPSSLSRSTPTARQSLPNLSGAQSFVSDESSWPTPDTVLEKERKEVTEKETEEKRDDEATPTTKRKKQEWKVLPVTPSIKFETQIMNESKGKPRGAANGERGRGSGSRGRGGHRGAQNGANVDRHPSRTGTSPTSRDVDAPTDSRGQPSISGNESVPSKPKRASSASSWRERKPDLGAARSVSGQTPLDTTSFNKAATSPWTDGAASASRLSKPPPRAPGSSRTESPKKMDTTEESRLDDLVPSPIPRPSSNAVQTQGAADGVETTARDTLPPRAAPADGRKDSRGFENSRDTPATGPRGGRRGGRGRGAARDLANGNLGNHTYPGNYAAEFASAGPYGMPQSPSAYQAQREQHQFNYPVLGRGGWNNRGNLRSQSIPIESNYYQRSGHYSAGAPPPHLAPINTYIPGMFDPTGVPMTAMPYPNQMDPQYVIQMVATQLDYYFSVDNLLKDMFLRKHMDSQGYVFMEIVAGFNRVKQLTQDQDIIRTACMNSDVIEIRVGDDGKERLRKAEGWEQFLLPIEQRDESAQNNGPEHLQRPERPQLQVNTIPPQFRGPASTGGPSMHQGRADRRSYDAGYPMNGVPQPYGAFGGIPEVMYGEMNGEEMRGRAAKSPIHETPISPMGQPIDAAFEDADAEPDAFPDEQAEMLTVVVKMSQQQRLPYHNLSSRTFSNGSIDTHILSEADRSAEGSSQPKKDGPPTVNGSDSKLPPIPLTRRASPNTNKPRSGERAPSKSSSSDFDVFWVKDQEFPVASLPADLTSEPYIQLRHKALDQRNRAATGTCPYDMDVLFQFWCHFLIRNFNNRMYTEFARLANEDARQRHNHTGMQNLIKFYDQSLRSQNTIRERVVRDYVRLVRSEPPELQGGAFKTLRAAWRNGALPLKNRKKVLAIVDKKFEEQLERLDA